MNESRRPRARRGAPSGGAPGERALRERLAALYPASSRRTLKQWLEAGRVAVNGHVVRRGDVTVAAADHVTLGAPALPACPAPLRLVHEDDEILVVDKPPGLLTIATERERERTAYRLLTEYVRAREGRRLFVVHRLDRETSGLVVFAKSPAAKQGLQAQFGGRRVERVYVAVVEGSLRDATGTLQSRLAEDRARRVRPARGGAGGREAITHYTVLARGGQATRLELRLETGRRAQIRVQLAALGHPIVGDHAHGSRRDPLRRLCLHATRLGFVHPRGAPVRFESAPPPAFLRLA
ncbi:MAG: RluA family pseudouridine synthase [Candidatus Rokuibacteriota bacterium]